MDESNNILYVADSNNNRILSYNITLSSASIGIPANQVYGQIDTNGNPSFIQYDPNNGNATPSASSLRLPGEIKYKLINNINYLFIADNGNNRILRYNLLSNMADYVFGQIDTFGNPSFTMASSYISASNNNLGSIISNGYGYGYGIAIDSINNIYISDPSFNRILYVDMKNNKVANKVYGQGSFTTSFMNNGNGNETTTLGYHNPTSLFMDKYGRLLISDTGNNRILRMT